MDPQQELFTYLLLKLREEFGEGMVYDTVLPPEETPYPFVYLGNVTFSESQRTKTPVLNQTVSVMLHVWHDNPKKRGTVSDMLMRMKLICHAIVNTGTYTWRCVQIDSGKILPDNTTKTPLIHGVFTVDFELTGNVDNEKDV